MLDGANGGPGITGDRWIDPEVEVTDVTDRPGASVAATVRGGELHCGDGV